MYLRFNELINFYLRAKQENSNLFIYDDVETLKYDEIHKDFYDINIKMIKTENIYRLFIFIGKDGNLLFNGMINESSDNLSNEYNILLNDINSLTFENLIDKYYESLKNNL